MRKPETIEYLYLDFDGFFASVEQQARPALRGKPVGVVPFDNTLHTVVIACSKEAKARGVKNVMNVKDAKRICPEIVLVAQSPDLYRRAHDTLIAEINAVIPIDVIKSIDELACKLDARDITDPDALSDRIKTRIHHGVGPHITCSIGFAANRHLAKIACKMDKPNGTTIWHPENMPEPLLGLPFDDIPGVGHNMEKRLHRAGIFTVGALLKTQPKQMRKIWGNVTGERLWYALHGYDVKALPSQRSMYGHGRVLPPKDRSIENAQTYSRVLLVKAARRMRRDGHYASELYLWVGYRTGRDNKGKSVKATMPAVNDDHACLTALEILWCSVRAFLPSYARIVRLGVTLGKLSFATSRQTDMFMSDDPKRIKHENITKAVDALNWKYGKTIVTQGHWKLPDGGNVGGKIAFTRIPAAEDFR